MIALLYCLALLSLLTSGGIFGFFYAWVCSTMWGLDAANPAIAIAAMQAMNATVRNMVFAPIFFGTPFVLTATALVAWRNRLPLPAALFFLAGLIYLCGGMILSMVVNVPMNEALAATAIPADTDEARLVWQAYSQPWQFWNTLRTVASGLALVLTGIAIMNMRPRTA